MTDIPLHWLAIGFLGQGIFTARFLVQWIASERKQASVVPIAFWWLSLLGGGTLLAYALYRKDPVIILGQLTGLVVYSRNLVLIARNPNPHTHTHTHGNSGTSTSRQPAAAPAAIADGYDTNPYAAPRTADAIPAPHLHGHATRNGVHSRTV